MFIFGYGPSGSMADQRVGEVTHFFGHLSVATIRVEKPIAVGDRLHIKGAHDNVQFKVDSIQFDHKPIERADKGQDIGVKVPSKVHEGSVVYKGTPGGPGKAGAAGGEKKGFWAKLFGR